MRLTTGADVYSSAGEKLGSLDRVILDPETKEVTHIVIERGLLSKTRKVVSMDRMNDEIDEQVTLTGSKHDLDDYPDFEETHYISADETDYPAADSPTTSVPTSFWYPPTGLAWWRVASPAVDMPYNPVMPAYVTRTRQNIPEGTVALEEGAKVMSSDEKHIGNIAQVIVDTDDNRVTHFVVDEGFLFKDRKLIPVLWISEIDEDAVYLSATAKVLERLPEYQATR